MERVVRSQVTVPDAWLQVHPLPVAETKPAPAGRGSVTLIPLAASGPLFGALGMWGGGAPGARASVLTVDGSGSVFPPVTVVVSASLLSAGSGSTVAAEMVAVLVMIPLDAGDLTMITIERIPSAGMLLRVQVTTPDAWLQVQFVPAALTKVAPVGSVSGTGMGGALRGAALAGG